MSFLSIFCKFHGSTYDLAYLFYFFVESDQVPDLHVGDRIQQLLVLAVVEAYVLLNLLLGSLVGLLEEGQP